MTVLVVHAAATFFMIGLIWVVQLLLYPAFRYVPEADFIEFEAAHTRRMGLVLAVPAPLEVITGAWLVWERPSDVGLWLVLIAGAVLAAAWVLTALVQARIHGRLSKEHDAELVDRLIVTNWWRTALWTVRGTLVLAMLI
ncbi:MAG: hypothetical protein HKN91_10050 [Acidimicrobiia bacterium]|nr:hypothetical protein [Acidimicrobiia bacterium]